MSKITNALLMMKLLSNGRVYSVKELSEELGVTERMVRNYKEQLEMSGYIIESFKGPGGGYFINKNNFMNIKFFNKYDLEVLDRIENEVIINDNELNKDFTELNKKLHSIYNSNKVLSEYKDVNVLISKNDEKVKIINNCINNKNNLLIDYLGSSGKITKREIIPINVFEFENNIYVTAFCKLRGAMRIFTLSKITNVMKK
ncbi:MAG: HTH domain-containing protein [Bacilli bacterium]|jgi:hypothetical protein|nr:HTH domain-containing protein [Bacilli bacterium]